METMATWYWEGIERELRGAHERGAFSAWSGALRQSGVEVCDSLRLKERIAEETRRKQVKVSGLCKETDCDASCGDWHRIWSHYLQPETLSAMALAGPAEVRHNPKISTA